jgi:hypothetical protein
MQITYINPMVDYMAELCTLFFFVPKLQIITMMAFFIVITNGFLVINGI